MDIQDIQEVLKVEGTLPDAAEVNRFLSMVQEADLRKHQAQKTEIEKTMKGIRVTLFIKSEAEALLKNALATGTLAQWSNNFEIKDVT